MWKIMALAFFAACVYLWFPAHRFIALASVGVKDPVPAGEITRQFTLHQDFRDLGVNIPIESRRREVICLGIKFATFQRSNVGEMKVLWKQKSLAKLWLVNATELSDNDFRYFCPGHSFEPDAPFSVDIQGVDSVAGTSPTLWLTRDKRYGEALVNGIASGRSVDFVVAREVHVGYRRLIALDRGAFVIAWVCTLLIGLVSILLIDWRSLKGERF